MVGSVKPKKYLGQHFLIDENISKKIIEFISTNAFFHKAKEVSLDKEKEDMKKMREMYESE